MSFLNPVILFAALSAALPVLIHLFARRRTTPIPFSSLYFLKELQNRQMRRIKIRQILLLIIRTLILLFLVFAFARPTLKQHSSGLAQTRAQTAMAVILDNSFSMQRSLEDATLLEQGRRSAEMIAGLMQPGDEMHLITPTDTGRILSQQVYSDIDEIREKLNDIEIDPRSADLNAALRCAVDRLMHASALNKEIYILSDFQATSLNTDSVPDYPQSIRVFGKEYRSGSVYNLSIQHMQLVSTILQIDQTAEAQVDIKNTGSMPVENALAEIFIGQERVQQFPVSLSVGETRSVSLKFPISAGHMDGRIVLSEDNLNADNVWYFSFYVPVNTSVTLCGETEFLDLVLNRSAEKLSQPFSVQYSDPAQLNQYLADSDVIMISNVSHLDHYLAENLSKYVKSGNGLVVILGERTDLRSFNQTLIRQLDLPRLIEPMGDYKSRQTVFSLGTIDVEHPLFSGVFSDKVSFEKPEFYFAIRAERQNDINPIIEFSNGSPFLFEKRFDQGTVLVLTTGLNPGLSDFAYRTIFAPLISRMVRYAGTRSAAQLSGGSIGTPLEIALPAFYGNEPLTFHNPDHIDRISAAVTPDRRIRIEYKDTRVPGIYGLYAGSELLKQWAVNVEPKESDFTIIDREKLDIHYLNQDSIKKEIQAQRYGIELWPFFAWAVLLLIVLEMMLYRVPVGKN